MGGGKKEERIVTIVVREREGEEKRGEVFLGMEGGGVYELKVDPIVLGGLF